MDMRVSSSSAIAVMSALFGALLQCAIPQPLTAQVVPYSAGSIGSTSRARNVEFVSKEGAGPGPTSKAATLALPSPNQAADQASDRSRLASLITSISDLLDKTAQGAQGSDEATLEKLRSSSREALQLARKSASPKDEAQALHGLAVADQRSGNLAEAVVDYTAMLEICISLGNHAGANFVLRERGWLYSLQNKRDLAEADYRSAIIQAQMVTEHHGEVDALNLLSGLLVDLGRFREALDAGRRAEELARQQQDLAELAVAFAHLGDAYLNLGDFDQALNEAKQQLQLGEQLNSRQTRFSALGAMSEAYARQHKLPEAKDSLERAAALMPPNQVSREHAYLLSEQCTISGLQLQEGAASKEDTLSYCKRALEMFAAGGDRANEANIREVIGFVYSTAKDHEHALEYLESALPAAASGGDVQLQSSLFFYLMQEYRQSKPALAISFGKQAINLIQQVRSDSQSLNRNLRTSFVNNKGDIYRELADLLITQGRYAEAIQVLDLLKQRDLSEYVNAGGTDGQVAIGLALTAAERQAELNYQATARGFESDDRRRTELGDKDNPTPAEIAEYRHLTDLASVDPRVSQYLRGVDVLFKQPGSANQGLAAIRNTATELQRELALAPGTVGLYTLVMPDRYRVLVITSSSIVAREALISKPDLDARINQFRLALKNPEADAPVLTQAKDLYNILFRPVQNDLDAVNARTVVWSLDDHLRYVPVAALHDGQHYLVERYSMAGVTPFSLKYLAARPDLAHMRAVAMGLSGTYLFQGKEISLPAVPFELRSVVRDGASGHGAFPGTILLDGSFTKKRMDTVLDGTQSVVHIASHFAVRPDSDDEAFLLLAGEVDQQPNGYHFTVASFRDDTKIRLEHTELFTLSACGTADLEMDGDGREVDGIAATAHSKGARAVLSTLWNVHDVSTAPFMADFYQRWVAGNGAVTKAEALRQAQLDLLSGRVVPNATEIQAAGTADFKHPVFWAPFVLTGNWK